MTMTAIQNIVLVGPMGSGKTTIGRLLAKKLKMDFVDSDQYLEDRLGISIAWMFDQEGEEGFRHRESNVLETLLNDSQQVIATGGGVVTIESNRQLLKQAQHLVVYLRPELEQLCQRLRYSRNRPLLENSDDREETIRKLFESRDPLYRQVADITFTGESPSQHRQADKLSKEIQTWHNTPAST